MLSVPPEEVINSAPDRSASDLESKGFALPGVFVVPESRGRIAASLCLDFVIDDSPEKCMDVVVDSRARAILVWSAEEKGARAASGPTARHRCCRISGRLPPDSQ
jgi:hypothetical protein